MNCIACKQGLPHRAKFCSECGAPQKDRSINSLIERFISDYGYTRSQSVTSRLRVWQDLIGHLNVDELDGPTLERHREDLLRKPIRGGKTLSPSSVRRCLFDLKKVFTES